MTSMLPAKRHTVWNLQDVFQSAEASILGQDNALRLTEVTSAIVVMVDGLGYENLRLSSGFLQKNLGESDFAHCGFPSTTVSSLASFASGTDVSGHGLFGYSIFNRSSNEQINLLSGLDKFSILDYLKIDPISTRSSLRVHAVTLEDYEESGFTRATMHGAVHHYAQEIEDRLEIARSLATDEPGSLVYVYAPELDREAHRSGVGSSNWNDLLVKFDRAIQKTVAKLKPGVGLLVTADHGIVDVSASDHIFLDDCPAAKNSLSNVSGDPRSPYLYLSEPEQLQEIKGQLIEFLSDRAFVAEPGELVELGYWSAKLLEEDDLMPDLVVIARKSFALFHRDFAKPSSLLMVGHHGSIDEVETKVPILRFGDYSSSLLVP